MKITIDIDTNNHAFWKTCYDSENPTLYSAYSEVERIVKQILPKIHFSDHGKYNDITGNTVARFTVEREENEIATT